MGTPSSQFTAEGQKMPSGADGLTPETCSNPPYDNNQGASIN